MTIKFDLRMGEYIQHSEVEPGDSEFPEFDIFKQDVVQAHIHIIYFSSGTRDTQNQLGGNSANGRVTAHPEGGYFKEIWLRW